jgi:hypothetical protein
LTSNFIGAARAADISNFQLSTEHLRHIQAAIAGSGFGKVQLKQEIKYE